MENNEIELRTEQLDAIKNPENAIKRAAELLKNGQIVAFPTETVYGLGATIFNEDAVKKIFTAKSRPSDNPLIAHIAELDEIERLAINIPKEFHLLASAFFPGALTVVLFRRPEVPSIVSAGLPTIAIRQPDHEIALSLIREVKEPLVAPSANRSGRPSPTSAHHVTADLDGRISAVLNGGTCRIGIESTVLSLIEKQPIILRPGDIRIEEIEEILHKKVITTPEEHTNNTAVSAPGMKYRHYAPEARVVLFENKQDMNTLDNNIVLLGINESNELKQETLYAELRRADDNNAKEIWIYCSPETLTNHGLMNRLKKASKG